MKLIVNIIMIFFAFTWISSVYADKGFLNPSPESIVTCQAGGPQIYMVVSMSLPAAINAEQCIETPDNIPGLCAPCIVSLEDQGCRNIDVVTGISNEFPIVTYLLSCAKP